MSTPNHLEPIEDVVPRRPLRPEELARLRQLHEHAPEQLARCAEDQALTELLHQLPHAPMPEDFTHRILQALDAPESRRPQESAEGLRWFQRLPSLLHPFRFAGAAAALLLALVIWWPEHASSPPPADSLALVASPVRQAALVTQLPAVEVWQNFEAIDQIRRLSVLADEDLLASLEYSHP